MSDSAADPLIDVAAAVADGAIVDWRALEATAATPEARDRIRRLELLAGIGRIHADLTFPRPDESRLHESILHPSTQPAASLDASPAPVTWGPLTIVRKVGRGTFGDVYLARESRLDRNVALKLLRHKDSASAASSDVIEEARLMAQVRHPSVTTIYGAERIDGRVGLWMEFIDGQTLEEELQARGPFSAVDVQQVGTAVASALSAVHRAGLLHRDVKAHNVMRDKDGRLLLTDFGTGRPFSPRGSELIDELAGSPLYLAPEVLTGGVATVQSDLYSLGVLLFRLATGEFPVQGRSLDDLRTSHATSKRSRLAEARREFPAGLSAAIDRALDADPTRRPATADVFVAALADGRSRQRRIRMWPWLVTAAAIVAAAAVGMWAMWPRGAAGSDALERTVLQGNDANNVVAVSPDGLHAAFVDNQGNLGILDFADGSRRMLATSSVRGAAYAGGARFSHDGRRLAYEWTTSDKDQDISTVRIIDLDHPAQEPPAIYTASEDATEFGVYDWSADGQMLAAAVTHYDAATEILLVPTDGAPAKVLTSLDWFGADHMAFSPDGRYLAYDAKPGESSAGRDIFVISTTTAEKRPLALGDGFSFVVSWTQGDGLLIASNRHGRMSLWRQAMMDGSAQGEPMLVKAGIHENTLGSTSDGRVFYKVVTRDQPLQIAPVDLATGKAAGRPRLAVVPGQSDYSRPSWSPDGRWFTYVSSVSSDQPSLPTQRILTIQSTTGGANRIMAVQLARWYTCSWAKDGRSLLVFALSLSPHVGIYRLDALTGDTTPMVEDDNKMFPWMGQWANDGRHFYYMRGPDAWTSSIETEFVERDTVSRSDRVIFRDRDLKQPNGSAAPALRDWTVSPDGAFVAGLETNRTYHAIWIARLGSHQVREIYRVPEPPGDCAVPITHFGLVWRPDSQAVIVNAGVSCPEQRELRVVPIDGKQAAYPLDIGPVHLRNSPPAVNPTKGEVAFQSGPDPTYEVRSLRYRNGGR